MPSDNKSLRQLDNLARRLIEIREWPAPSELDQQSALQPIVEAVIAVTDCLDGIAKFKGDGPGRGLTKPLWDLLVALKSNLDGIAHPLFTPPKTGKRTKSLEQQTLMGWSAVAFHCYQKAGFARPAAGTAVANELGLVKLNHGRTAKPPNGKTVANWVNKMREGEGSAGPYALAVWHKYLNDREADPLSSPQTWVDWAVEYLRAHNKNRLILQSPPKKVED